MDKTKLLLMGIMFSVMFVCASSVSAYVHSGDFSNFQPGTTYSFGDNTNNLVVTWVLPSSVGYFLGPNNSNTLYPGTSQNLLFNLGDSVDIDTLDTETEVSNAVNLGHPGWHDMAESFLADQWVAFKGLNGYYGVMHIKELNIPAFGPPPTISGTWYYQDDGSSYFGSPVPVPGTIWLLGSGLIAVARFRKRTQN